METLHQLAIQRYFDLETQKVEDFLTKTWEPLFLKNFLGTSQILDKLQNVSLIDESVGNQIEEALSLYLTDPAEARTATDAIIEKLNTTRRMETDDVQSVVSDYVEDEKISAAVIHITSLLGTDDPARIILEFAEAAHVEMNDRRRTLLAPIEQARAETAAELSGAYAEIIRGHSTITGRLEAAAKVSEQQDQLLGVLGIKGTTQGIQEKMSMITQTVDNALGLAGGLGEQEATMSSSLQENIQNTLITEFKKILAQPESE
jgi:hypothetical protein